MKHFDAPYLAIHWNETLRCVHMEWKSFVAGDDFRHALERGLGLAFRQGTQKWLADLRGLQVIPTEDQTWANEIWFPRAVRSGIRYMAFVQPKSVLAQMSVDAIMQVAEIEHRSIETGYFDTVVSAESWFHYMDRAHSRRTC